MAAKLYYSPFIPAFNSNGLPVSGAQLRFRYTGTTTPAPIYSDSGLTVELENPVEADAIARFPEIYLDDSITYRIDVLGPSGIQIGTVDPYVPGRALKGDPGGNVMATGLATLVADQSIAAGTDVIRTTGYDAVGRGAAFYFEDSLADAALLAAHPRAVKQDSAGRIFRLMPWDSAINVDQLGAAGEVGQNDQPIIQAALDYAAAVGISEVRFPRSYYEIWCPEYPVGGTEVSDNGTNSTDGRPLVVTGSVTLVGTANVRTTLNFKGLAGVDPDTNWQEAPTDNAGVNPADPHRVWRGGGIFLAGDLTSEADPGEGNRAIERFEMRRIILKGNRTRDDFPGEYPGSPYYPASIVTGKGWDTTDRGIELPDRRVGEIVLSEVDIHGFKGELFYRAGIVHRETIVDRCHFHTTSGNAWNPGGQGGDVLASNSRFGNAYIAWEDTGKTFARYVNCQFYDSNTASIGNGPTDGYYANGNYLYPTRDDAEAFPGTILEGVEFSNVPQIYVGSWVRGKVRTVDCSLQFTYQVYPNIRSTFLDIEAVLDRETDAISPLVINGPPTLTTAITGVTPAENHLPVKNLNINLTLTRSEVAIAANEHWDPVEWSGYIDPAVTVKVGGALRKVPRTANCTSMPLIEPLSGAYTDTSGAEYGLFTNYIGEQAGALAITPDSPSMGWNVNAYGAVTIASAPAGGASYGYAHGQRLRIVCLNNATEGFGMGFRNGVSNYKVEKPCLLWKALDWIEFEFDRANAVWREVGRHVQTPYNTKVAFDAPSVAAAGATTTTLTTPHLDAGDRVAASCVGSLGGLILSAAVTAAGTTTLTLFNPTAGAIDLGALDYRVEAV